MRTTAELHPPSTASGDGDHPEDGTSRPRVAVVRTTVNGPMVHAACDGLTSELAGRAALEFHTVPGAFELPLFSRRLAATHRVDAVVAVGFVVDGGIYRHEFVADAVIGGLMRVQLDTGVPVFSCVLTPQQFHEHQDHRDFFTDHMGLKGHEVGRACLETLQALAVLSS